MHECILAIFMADRILKVKDSDWGEDKVFELTDKTLKVADKIPELKDKTLKVADKIPEVKDNNLE